MKKPLKVRELMALLAECHPEGEVQLTVPSLLDATDAEVFSQFATQGRDDVLDEFDNPNAGFSVVPVAEASFLTGHGCAVQDEILDENNKIKADAKPNNFTLSIAPEDFAPLYDRRRQGAFDKPEIEPRESDADTVILDLAIPRQQYDAIRTLVRAFNQSHQVRIERGCTHGLLTVTRLLEMLAEDVAMVETRPGCWEASNMAQVFSSHGYN